MIFAIPESGKGWALRAPGKVVSNSRDLEELAGARNDVVVGVPASLATTFSVLLPTQDRGLISTLVPAQIDKRGLDSAVWSHQVVEDDGGSTLVTVDVLAASFPETLSLPKAAGYSPAARLLNMPENRLFLWKEHGRLVFAANRHGIVTHVQSLGAAPELGVAAAQEILLSALSLQGEGLLGDTPELTVAGDIPGDRASFESAVTLPVEFVASPDVRRPSQVSVADEFLPIVVSDSRNRSNSRRKRGIAVFAIAAAYLIASAFIWLFAKRTERTITKLEGEAAFNRPLVAEIQESEARWKELEPGFALQYFPVVQLNEVTKVMPPSGVVLQEYETKGRNISIRGQAKDVQLAFGMLEALKGTPFFVAYEWSMDQPKVENNNTASFRILGKPIDAGT